MEDSTDKTKETPKEQKSTEVTPKEEKSFIEKTTDSIESSLKETGKSIGDSIEKVDEKLHATVDAGVKKTRSFLKKLFFGLLILAVLAGIGYMIYANYTYSEGRRAGTLIKISKKGYIFKTYEGQLKLGGIDLNNPDDGLSDTWSFSVKDEAVFQNLERLQGEQVVVRYKEINQAMPWQGDTNYFIFEIEERK